MSTTVKVQIQQRIDTASAWTTANPTLLAGEVGWESDTKKYKIGDGSTAWASLTYAPGSGGYTAGTGVSISGSNVITASAVALTTVQTAANETAMLALTTQEGDVVVRSDENKSYVRNSGSAGSMADFTLLATPTDAVLSVNGNTGAITADQLAAAIESATDSNKFTDADHTKLNGIAASANNYAITSDLLDEDNFASNSATKPASQQSTKAYVDTADALKANLSGATFTGDVVFTGDAANVTWDKSTDDLIFNDNAKAIFGTSSDGVAIYHDGSNSYILDDGTGDLIIKTTSGAIRPRTDQFTVKNAANNETILYGDANASCALYYDNSKKLETTSSGATVTGTLIADQFALLDNEKATYGDNNDLEIYHDGSSASLIDAKAGDYLYIYSDNLRLNSKTGTEKYVSGTVNGAVELYYDGSKKFETDPNGVLQGDSSWHYWGDSNDLYLGHNGTNSYVANTTGYLFIQSDDFSVGAKSVGENMIVANVNDGVDLYFDGSKKLETTSSGLLVSGTVAVSGGSINLGVADTASGHINAYEAMTFNIDTDNDDTNRTFEFCTGGADGSGTTLLTINESGDGTFAGSLSDSKGDLRTIVQVSKSAQHTIVAADSGKHSINSTGGWVINTSTGFTAGQAITLINNSGSNQTVTNTGCTMYLAGDTSAKSSLTLKGRGVATFICTASNVYYGSGAGLE